MYKAGSENERAEVTSLGSEPLHPWPCFSPYRHTLTPKNAGIWRNLVSDVEEKGNEKERRGQKEGRKEVNKGKEEERSEDRRQASTQFKGGKALGVQVFANSLDSQTWWRALLWAVTIAPQQGRMGWGLCSSYRPIGL